MIVQHKPVPEKKLAYGFFIILNLLSIAHALSSSKGDICRRATLTFNRYLVLIKDGIYE
ncbi:hypothetical protein [Candidatus Finniella inopinata]|uniref:hypothetical protein n=1 Tax=Candidatus Finniella inopinata TaxID=1696036 RepID=UPI0013EE8815|nr:hypothetical protein [Candidatus Finniella inopinata]